jgi:hypothetical protein
MTSPSDELHRFSVEKILPRIARVRSTAEITAALRPARETVLPTAEDAVLYKAKGRPIEQCAPLEISDMALSSGR